MKRSIAPLYLLAETRAGPRVPTNHPLQPAAGVGLGRQRHFLIECPIPPDLIPAEHDRRKIVVGPIKDDHADDRLIYS